MLVDKFLTTVFNAFFLYIVFRLVVSCVGYIYFMVPCVRGERAGWRKPPPTGRKTLRLVLENFIV